MFAALLALPLLGLGVQSAAADYYCCGKTEVEHKIKWAYVVKDSTVFDCDSYHCETKIKLYGGTKVKAYCRNGWCHIKNFPFANVWVLEHCLKWADHDGDEGKGDDEGGNGENGDGDNGDEGREGEGYKRRHYSRY